MTKTNKMEDGRGRRLFADLNHAFRKDPFMYVNYMLFWVEFRPW